MRGTRRLTLRRETLTELVSDDLSHVVAGSGVSCVPALCLTGCSSCASDFQQCITGIGCLPTRDSC